MEFRERQQIVTIPKKVPLKTYGLHLMLLRCYKFMFEKYFQYIQEYIYFHVPLSKRQNKFFEGILVRVIIVLNLGRGKKVAFHLILAESFSKAKTKLLKDIFIRRITIKNVFSKTFRNFNALNDCNICLAAISYMPSPQVFADKQQVLQGREGFQVTCVAEAPLSTSMTETWSYPGQGVRRLFPSENIFPNYYCC